MLGTTLAPCLDESTDDWLAVWTDVTKAAADLAAGDPRGALVHANAALAWELPHRSLPRLLALAHRLQALARLGKAEAAGARARAEAQAAREWAPAEAVAALDHAAAVAALAAGDQPAARATAGRLIAQCHPTYAGEGHAIRARLSLASGRAHAARAHAALLRQLPGGDGTPRFAARADLIDGVADLDAHDRASACRNLHTALAVQSERGYRADGAETLDALARLASDRGDQARAGRLAGAATALREACGWPRLHGEQRVADELRGEAPDAYAEGQALSFADAVEYARRARGKRAAQPSGWAALSPMETRVAELAIEGLTNPQIGARLFVSRGTVKAHLAHVYQKLSVANRMQLVAAWSVRS